jgi:hypothetical protein
MMTITAVIQVSQADQFQVVLQPDKARQRLARP